MSQHNDVLFCTLNFAMKKYSRWPKTAPVCLKLSPAGTVAAGLFWGTQGTWLTQTQRKNKEKKMQ